MLQSRGTEKCTRTKWLIFTILFWFDWVCSAGCQSKLRQLAFSNLPHLLPWTSSTRPRTSAWSLVAVTKSKVCVYDRKIPLKVNKCHDLKKAWQLDLCSSVLPRNCPPDYSFTATLCKDHYNQSSEPTLFTYMLVHTILMAWTNGTQCALPLKSLYDSKHSSRVILIVND